MNVFFIGLLSFFGGISQDIFVPILPLYLKNILHLDAALIGLSEGLVTAGASIFRLLAGYLTDKYGKKKPIIFAGYFFSMVARPLLAFVTGGVAVLGLRFLDGAGKGIKDSPKDALIASSSVSTSRGKSFGIARMLDTLGSVAGPLLLFALLYIFQDHEYKYHLILLLSAIPLVFTLGILVWKVKEASSIPRAKRAEPNHGAIPSQFYVFLVIITIFAIGNSSDAFLILRAQNVGVTLLAIPLVYAVFNFVYATASVPLGSLSDRIGREKVMLIGWLAYALAYLGFASATSAIHIWILFAFYGLYYATTYGVAKAFVADMVPESHRGRAYGLFNTTIGVLSLPSSLIAGLLWDRVSPSAPFYFGAIVSGFSAVLLIIFMAVRQNKKSSH
ncbi:MAG: MFS transporter [Patescibacteria group bacterium]